MRFAVHASATALAVSHLFLATAARAADPTTADCLAAADRSADLRPQHKLRETRDKLLICSAASCPGDIREECVRRLSEVNAAMPTIVFDTKDTAGNDVAAVKVTMDGQLLATRLEGVALSIDPGEHSFTFEVAGQRPVQKSIVIHEGEKDRREHIVIGGPQADMWASSAGTGEQGKASQPRSRLLEWSLIGGGAAVGIVGAVLLAVEAGNASDANNQGDRSSYDSAITGWRVGLATTIVGAAAVMGGGILFATTRDRTESRASRSAVWFAVGATDLKVGGTW